MKTREEDCTTAWEKFEFLFYEEWGEFLDYYLLLWHEKVYAMVHDTQLFEIRNCWVKGKEEWIFIKETQTLDELLNSPVEEGGDSIRNIMKKNPPNIIRGY